MKKNFSDYFVALVVITCSLVLLGALTYALSGRRPGKNDRILFIDYPDVTGVKLHSEVRYAGAPAGTVTDIRLLTFEEREAAQTPQQKRNAVRVTVTLNKNMPPVPNDVVASLSSETLLSEKFVAFTAGSASAPKLENKALLQGQSGGGLDGLFAAIGPLADSLPPLLKTAEDSLKDIREAVDSVKVVVKDVGPRANKLLEGLKETSESADTAIKNINKLVDGPASPVKTNLDELKESLVKVQSTLGSANQLISRTDKSLDGRMQELSVVLQNLKVATTHAKALTQQLGERPNRLIFTGKPQKLTTEEEILRSAKPVPAMKPIPVLKP